MRPMSFRSRSSAVAWTSIVVVLGFMSGCQQWSFRKNMGGFFTAESKDDWEPPAKSFSEAAGAERQPSDPSSNRSWWNRRAANGVPRVVLPRDRGTPETHANATRANGSAQPPTVESMLPDSKPQVVKNADGLALPRAAGTANGKQDHAKPRAELVAFGANPESGPGPILPAAQPASDSREASNSRGEWVETGVEDVDLDASLRSLPPEFRDVVQRTIQAVKAGKPLEVPNAVNSQAEALPQVASNTPTPPALESSEPSGPVKARLTESLLTSIPAPDTTNPLDQANASLPPAQVAVAVAPPKTQESVIQTSATMPATPAATSPSKPGTWHSMISEAIERLESELESKPTADESLRRSQEMTLRMLYVSQRRLDDALRPIERMDAHEQEYVRHQMQALYEASNPDANPSRPRHWSTVMMSQREATAHLAAASNLEVRSVAFCTQVDDYGIYQKFPKNQFTPDQEVVLYCEIDNVAAEKVKAGFETQLQGSYEIRDVSGRLIVDQELPFEREVCMNHRRDYFFAYRIYMPSQIPAGNYELRLTIQDKKGGKYGHSTAAFEIRR